MLRRHFLPVTLMALLAAGASAREPGAPLKPGFNLFSRQQDIQLGQEAAQQVRQQYQTVQNQFLQNYLKRVGERLAGTAEAKQSGFPFNFTLVSDKSINAFALPGGPMFVFTGLLNAVENEAQLAGVMAHEMSHVILRHGTNQVSKANLIQLPAMLAGAVAGGSMLGQLAQLGIGLGANSVLLKYSRDAESQADALGSHMMAEVGYNPIEMARFFEKLQSESGNGIQFFSDHPNPGNRMRTIEAEIRTLPQRSYGFETGEFQQAKSQIASLPPPPARNTRTNLQPPAGAPSGGMRELSNRYFALQYPDAWQAYGDQNSGSVTIAPREGLVQTSRGGTSIGYGTVLSYFTPDSANAGLREATDDLIHHLRTENPGMRVTSRKPRSVRIAGSPGLVTMLESDSPYGGVETDAVLSIVRPEGLFYMVFIAPQQNFRNLESTFQRMIDSIRFTS